MASRFILKSLPAAARRGDRKRHDLLAARGIADRERAALLDFLDADDALHRQVQRLRILEFVAQPLFGRVDDDTLALLKHELTDLGESPQRTAVDVARVELERLAL